jgi:hypothetical protein
MHLAVVSGQPFADLLTWHPRDVATLVEHFEHEQQAREEAAAEERFAAARAALNGTG